ncbi:uncharacterized protein LOC109597922 isoform X2 [Aethina tumida]|uniref:uncharacterized protein LOC109597922 isoform X2 n=1 Tax=Aethina tumida TaxID=116153 RepID=UPI00214824C1|nr:uncharacterized protein LOC109597922 isoform X2 [Aethina tumida]
MCQFLKKFVDGVCINDYIINYEVNIYDSLSLSNKNSFLNKVIIVTCLVIFCGEYVYGTSTKRTNHKIDTREVVFPDCVVLCVPVPCPSSNHNESTSTTGRTTESGVSSTSAPQGRKFTTYHLKTEHFKELSKKYDDHHKTRANLSPPCIRICGCDVGECRPNIGPF